MHRAAILTSCNRLYSSGLLRIVQNGRFGIQVVHRKPTSTTSTSSSAAVVAQQVAQEPFLNGSSSIYVEEMYNAWLEDPNSVHKSWDAFFRNASVNMEPGTAYQKPPTIFPHASRPNLPAIATGSSIESVDTHRAIDDHLSVQAIIRSYQVCLSVYFVRSHNALVFLPIPGQSIGNSDAHCSCLFWLCVMCFVCFRLF